MPSHPPVLCSYVPNWKFNGFSAATALQEMPAVIPTLSSPSPLRDLSHLSSAFHLLPFQMNLAWVRGSCQLHIASCKLNLLARPKQRHLIIYRFCRRSKNDKDMSLITQRRALQFVASPSVCLTSRRVRSHFLTSRLPLILAIRAYYFGWPCGNPSDHATLIYQSSACDFGVPQVTFVSI